MYKNKPVLLQTSKHVPTFFPTTKKKQNAKEFPRLSLFSPTLTSLHFVFPFSYNSTSLSHSSMSTNAETPRLLQFFFPPFSIFFYFLRFHSTRHNAINIASNILIKIEKIPQILKKQSTSLSYLRPISFIYSFLFFTPPAAKTFCPISFPTENKKTRPT